MGLGEPQLDAILECSDVILDHHVPELVSDHQEVAVGDLQLDLRGSDDELPDIERQEPS